MNHVSRRFLFQYAYGDILLVEGSPDGLQQSHDVSGVSVISPTTAIMENETGPAFLFAEERWLLKKSMDITNLASLA